MNTIEDRQTPNAAAPAPALDGGAPVGTDGGATSERTDMTATEVTIDGERLIADLKRLREFGGRGTGVVRTSLSPVDVESRHWLCRQLDEAGLDARIDGAGNVFGRSRNAGKAVVIGSHTDTQPTGGWLDGAMGVICGLEVARALAETPATKAYAVDVASWLDEEGRFYGCFGSLSFVGETPAHALDSVDSTDGTDLTLRDALRAAGLEGVAPERLDPERHIAYLEAHIEQGPYLDEEGNRIGVVTSIVGSRNFTVEFNGEQNHAGTTPMSRRRDAAHAMVEFAHTVYREFPAAAGERSVWTIGEMAIEPNAVSIVPGKARLNLQFRDQDPDVLDRLEALSRDLLARANKGPCRAAMRPRTHHSVPAPMGADLRRHLERAAERHASGRWTSMPSAAVHDAQILAGHLPSAMLFVPSINGVSHAFEENTSEEDIVLGCQVLATATASVLAASS